MKDLSAINDIPRKRGKHHPVAEKKAAIEKWKASGLSKAEFCRREGLSAKLFYSWTYLGNTKARKESSQEMRLIPAKFSRSSKPETVLEPAPQVLPVSQSVVINLKNGITIKLPLPSSTQSLIALVKELTCS